MSRLDDSIFDDDSDRSTRSTDEDRYSWRREESYTSREDGPYTPPEDSYLASSGESYSSSSFDGDAYPSSSSGSSYSSYDSDLYSSSSSYDDDLYSSSPSESYSTPDPAPYSPSGEERYSSSSSDDLYSSPTRAEDYPTQQFTAYTESRAETYASYDDDLYGSAREDTYSTQEHALHTPSHAAGYSSYEDELDDPTGEHERVHPVAAVQDHESDRRLTRSDARRTDHEEPGHVGRDHERHDDHEHHDDHGRDRRDDRDDDRGWDDDGGRRRGRRGCGVSCLVMLLAGALVIGAIWFAAGSLGPLIPGFGGPKDYPGPGHGSVEVTVDSGASGSQIGEALVTAGVVKSTSSFTQVAMAQPERAAKIQPGRYSMLKEMKAADAFELLLDPESKVVKGLTIPEGQWRSEIYTRLSEGTGVPLSDYDAAETSPALKLPEEAGGSLEGWLFPSTYDFPEDATAIDQLNTMIAQTTEELEKAGVPREDWERTLIIASIVEGEAGAADRAKVARVIENRLEDVTGPTVGMLQMDSTIHYMLQKRGTVTTSDKERNTDSPYNTYKNKGLPPGPINNPGAAAIEAASHPDEGDWLFFVTVDPETGETKFTKDPDEHQDNVQEFCRNTGSCE